MTVNPESKRDLNDLGLPTDDQLRAMTNEVVDVPAEHQFGLREKQRLEREQAKAEKTQSSGLGKKIGAGLGITGLAVAGIFGVKTMNKGDKTPAPENTPTASAPAVSGNPTEAEPTAPTETTEPTKSTPDSSETNKSPETGGPRELVGDIVVTGLSSEAKAKAALLEKSAPTDDVWEVKMSDIESSGNRPTAYAETLFVLNSSMMNLGQDNKAWKEYQDNPNYAAGHYSDFAYEQFFLPAFNSSTANIGTVPDAATKAAFEARAERTHMFAHHNITEVNGVKLPKYERFDELDLSSIKVLKDGDGINTPFSVSFEMTVRETQDLSPLTLDIFMDEELGKPKCSTTTVTLTDVLESPSGAMVAKEATSDSRDCS